MQRWISLLFVLLVLFAVTVRASSEDGFEEELSVQEEEDLVIPDVQEQLNPVQTAYDSILLFSITPENENKKSTLGSTIGTLMTASNIGKFPLNLTMVGGYFVHPQDQTFVLQNFTRIPVGAVMNSRDQVSVEYRVGINPALGPVDIVFIGEAFFSDLTGKLLFRKTFLNETFEILEAPLTFDVATVSSYIFFFSVFGLAVYILVSMNVSTAKRVTRKISGGNKTPTVASDEVLDDYLPAELKGKLTKKKAPTPKK